MTSKTQKVKRIRNWKDKPNKANRKADEKRFNKNMKLLKESAS